MGYDRNFEYRWLLELVLCNLMPKVAFANWLSAEAALMFLGCLDKLDNRDESRFCDIE